VGGQEYDFGAQLSDEWTGTSWKRLPSPRVSGHSELTAVACPAAHECIAVGSGGTKIRALAQTWNGTSWTLTAAPVVPAHADSSYLRAIACSGRSDCLAVGTYYTSKVEVNGISLAESWNGHTWTLLPSPANATAFNAVACPAANVCVAVGAGRVGFQGEFSIASAEWNGSSWTPLTTPSPAKLYTQSLYGVSCTSAANCVAVGSGPGGTNGGNGTGPFAEHWTGGSGWSLESMPDPEAVDFSPDGEQSPDNSLSSVSCTSPARCMAVGGEGYSNALSAYASFAVSWNGRDWSVSRTGKVDGLMGVSCAPGRACLATGTYLDRDGVTQTLAESWNGSRVRLVSPKGLRGILSAVSCPTASFCAVANESSAASWNGTHWNWSGISHTDLDGQLTGTIGQLSCVSRDFCMAIFGSYDPVTEFWNGKSWNLAAVKVPKGYEVEAGLASLSCVSRNFCLATGSYLIDDGQDDRGGNLAEVWNGSAWRIISVPGQSTENAINAVACRTSTNCMTIGDGAADGKTILLGASWNGHTWMVTRIPGSYGNDVWQGGAGGPSSLSCPTATSCVAVGSFAPVKGVQPGTYSDIGLIWNGHSWRTTRPGGPAGISSVSCASARDCVAIGLPGITTLAKLWNGSTWKVLKTINP
jgi:hypothetical protein